MSKKHCMFQCVLQQDGIFGYTTQHDIVEDTDLITWDEAVELWEKWKPKVVKQLEDEQSPEMVIWTGCKDNTSYRTDAFHVNYATKVANDEFIEVVEKKIDPTTVTMGEPV
jgi:DNA topoisomerase VI subunit A